MNNKDITIGVLLLIIIGGATALGLIGYIVYKIYLWFMNYDPFAPITKMISDTKKTVSKIGSGSKKAANKVSSGSKSTTSKTKKKIGI
jgi:hypothetical protein